MAADFIQPGSRVVARDAFGRENVRIAITGVVLGQDFPVVWLCTPVEWEAAQLEGRDPDGVPFPSEDVWTLENSIA